MIIHNEDPMFKEDPPSDYNDAWKTLVMISMPFAILFVINLIIKGIQ